MKLGTWEASVKAKDPKARLSSLQFFIIGAISKTIATIVTYPYIMAKTRLQSKYSENSGVPKYKDTMDVLAKVYQAEGIVGWVSVPPFFFFFSKGKSKPILCDDRVWRHKFSKPSLRKLSSSWPRRKSQCTLSSLWHCSVQPRLLPLQKSESIDTSKRGVKNNNIFLTCTRL